MTSLRYTRRYWGVVGAVALLVVWAAVVAQVELLLGAAGLVGWLLAQQFLFVAATRETVDQLTITQSPSVERVSVGRPLTVTVTADRPTASTVDVGVVCDPPAVGSTAETAPFVALTSGALSATATFDIIFPVAGRFSFGRPTVTTTDALGFFRATLDVPVEDSPTVVVTSVLSRVRNLTARNAWRSVAYGGQPSGVHGSGLEPDGLREFIPGDSLRRIDWKATARQGSLFVREYEEESDRRTILIVDHSAEMGQGVTGETKLDYARLVALTFLTEARVHNEPLGLYTVGDETVTSGLPPESTADGYGAIRRRLYELEPDGVYPSSDTGETPRRPPELTLEERVRIGRHLRGDDPDRFEAALQPFLTEFRRREETVVGTENRLPRVVDRHLLQRGQRSLVVIVTDDSNRPEVRDAVRRARQRAGQVFVFLAPTVLFEPGRNSSVEDAFARYERFIVFKNTLSRLSGVTAIEVGPGDQIDRLITEVQARREWRAAT